jgi:hypothetical protein
LLAVGTCLRYATLRCAPPRVKQRVLGLGEVVAVRDARCERGVFQRLNGWGG